ncbi:uncharacterized protein N7484_000477 [Penicillium longicatenatum]|uniref:uncharacterized protein n=1 Tax=Penicillium longicatenatum TaxID=1561947 RepID=UPI002548134E|nr:uncharacterized protein N7484_000477 [Penicillium longicatenatum]KAJ5661105.1 hypothetical protein N7484_000477 [Penicillium longicatenatum]
MEHQPSSVESERENSLFLKLVYWHKLFESDAPPRLGIDVERRIPYATMCAFFPGLALGYVHGSKKAGLLFRAENAHRFPTTSTGWFQYHKTKNYISIVGGVKDGVKMGAKLGAGALAFSLFEETVDYARHEERDFLSTVTAGLSFSGIYSLLARHDVYTAARTAKFGLKLSLTYGLLQDVLETAKGNRPKYLDFFLGKRQSDPEEGAI